MTPDSDLQERVSRAGDAIQVDVPSPAEALRKGRLGKARRTAVLSIVVALVAGGLAWGISDLLDLGRRRPPSLGGVVVTPGNRPADRPIATEVHRVPTSAVNPVRAFDIYTVDARDGSIVNITPDEAEYFAPAWSPDGSRLAVDRLEGKRYNTDEAIYVMNADGTGLRQILDLQLQVPVSVYQIQYSPDGSQIAFVQVDHSTGSRESDSLTQLMVMDAGGTNLRALTGPEDGQITSFSWSPDGSQFVLTKQFLEEEQRFGWDLYLMSAQGGEPVQLTADGNSTHPAWSPDGSRIAFVSFEGGGFRHRGLYVMNADGTGRTRVIETDAIDEYPAWSPDGATIAFLRYADASEGDCRIMTIRPDGTGETEVANSSELDGCFGRLAW